VRGDGRVSWRSRLGPSFYLTAAHLNIANFGLRVLCSWFLTPSLWKMGDINCQLLNLPQSGSKPHRFNHYSALHKIQYFVELCRAPTLYSKSRIMESCARPPHHS
jgi:hypothetical protein